MERTKPPSLTSSSCSVSTSRAESSEGNFVMQSSLQNDLQTPNCVSRMRSQSDLSHEGKPGRSVSVITLRPWSPRPISGLSMGTHSESDLPMPRIAKFLDRGSKSAPILPSYPKVLPWSVNRDCNRSVIPPKSPVSHNSVQIPKLRIDLVEHVSSPKAELLPRLHPQISERSYEDTNRLLQFPNPLSCRSAPSRIPVRQTDIQHSFCTERRARSTDICYPFSVASSARSIDIPLSQAASSARSMDMLHSYGTITARESAVSGRNSSPQITGVYRRPSCIPIPLFNTMSREMLTERSVTPQTVDNQSSPRIPTPHPGVLDANRISLSTSRSDYSNHTPVMTPTQSKVPTLKALAEAAIPKSNQESYDSARSMGSVSNLSDLAKAAVDRLMVNSTKSEAIQEKPKVQSLTVLAQNAVGQLESRPESTKSVPSLKELAEKAIAPTMSDFIQQKPKVQSPMILAHNADEQFERMPESTKSAVPSLKELAEKDILPAMPEIIKGEEKMPSLKVLAQNAVDQFDGKLESTKMVVPSLREIAEKAIATPPAKVPTLKALANKVIAEAGIKSNSVAADEKTIKRSQTPLDTCEASQNITTSDWHFYSTERTQSKVRKEENIKAVDVHSKFINIDATESNIQVPDAWEHAGNETKPCSDKKERLVDLVLYFKNFSTKPNVPSLKELAEAAVKMNIWLQKCEEKFANPSSYTAMFASLDTEDVPFESTETGLVTIEKEPKHKARSLKERELKSQDSHRKRSRPVSRVSGNRRAVASAKARTEHETEEGIKRPYSVPLVGLNEEKKALLSARNAIEDKDNALFKDKKTNKRLTTKLDKKKIHRLRYGPGNISDKEIYELVDAIKEDDRDAAKVFKELQMLNEIEKETKMKESKLMQADIKIEEDIEDFRTKLEATKDKKSDIDKKLLEMSAMKLEPETEYDVIENYLYTENLARTYHEKINLEECCIAYLENEQKDNEELRKIINPKAKINHRKNGNLQNKGLTNKKGTATKTKPNNNLKADNKGKRGAQIFEKMEENSYKPVIPNKKEEALKKDKKDTRRTDKPVPSRQTKPLGQAKTRANLKKDSTAKTNLPEKRRQQEKSLPPLKRTVGYDKKQLDSKTSDINKQSNRKRVMNERLTTKSDVKGNANIADKKQLDSKPGLINKQANKSEDINERLITKWGDKVNANTAALRKTKRENTVNDQVKHVNTEATPQKNIRTPQSKIIPKEQNTSTSAPNRPNQKVNNGQRNTKRDDKGNEDASALLKTRREKTLNNQAKQVNTDSKPRKNKDIPLSKKITKEQNISASKRQSQKVNNGQRVTKRDNTTNSLNVPRSDNKNLKANTNTKQVTVAENKQNKKLNENLKRPKTEPNKLRKVTVEAKNKTTTNNQSSTMRKTRPENTNTTTQRGKQRTGLPNIQQKKTDVQQKVPRKRTTS